MREGCIEKIKVSLLQHDEIIFALLFGSAASGAATPMSDIDIGVYFSREPDLLEMGALTFALENICPGRVDLVQLNKLQKTNPVFCHSMLSTHRELFCRNREILTAFKRDAILHYLDIRPMRDMMQEALKQRIRSGRAGERNYARKD